MLVTVNNNCSDFSSYRAARVKSLFNVESGCNFSISADLPIEDDDWQIGVIVGPSGSGKSSLGRKIWGDASVYDMDAGWNKDKPIIDDISPDGDFNDVAASLSAVGLGDVPSWLRPYNVLSTGEKFRAALARAVSEKRDCIVIDEFTSVIDRQIAKVGSAAFSKAWRRKGGKVVLLTCHYDVLDWLEPDWVFDTLTGKIERGRLRRRPQFKLEVYKTDGSYWHLFEHHHYLKLPSMVAPSYYVGFVDGIAVCHVCLSPRLEHGGMRMARLVTLPEWQGIGVGARFLNEVARLQFTDANKYYERVKAVYIHSSHPGLCAYLRRSGKWQQVSRMTGGANGLKYKKTGVCEGAFYGGHIRAVQGFKITRAAALNGS